MVVDDIPQGPNGIEQIEPWNFPKAHLGESTMVLIRDSLPNNDFSVFPPINHENLLSKEEQHHPFPQTPPAPPSLSFSPSSSSSLSSSSSFSPSDSDASDPESPLASDSRLKRSAEENWWVAIGFEVLRSKLRRFASSAFGGNGAFRWKAWSFASGAGIAAVVVMLWSLCMWARLQRRQESLRLIVKEKDEKINKLLHQIAQMNELLIARHRLLASKVPN
ncbi:hypothetical protein PanWU01x14_092490 [Parasponia andersonii]|uniref:Transmembrane protein n=1 Tax=Parasponia andersonii TaxID=3476 RepID=A0A2P5D6J7_PARAD|nr:hypothetical protein PanWU01x14_092490 [Parasponia andersonii]